MASAVLYSTGDCCDAASEGADAAQRNAVVTWTRFTAIPLSVTAQSQGRGSALPTVWRWLRLIPSVCRGKTGVIPSAVFKHCRILPPMPVSISAFLFIHYLASTMHTVDERRKRVESARPIWNKLENKIYSEHNKTEKSQLNSVEKSQKSIKCI